MTENLTKQGYDLSSIDSFLKFFDEGKGTNLPKLSNKYGVKRQTIAKYLKTNGYEVINYQNLCRIDETIFDIIDTEDKAY